MKPLENDLYKHFVSLVFCDLEQDECSWTPDEHAMAKAIVKKVEEQEAEIKRLKAALEKIRSFVDMRVGLRKQQQYIMDICYAALPEVGWQ